MPSTSDKTIVNLQVMAEDQMNIDKANGTYDANHAADQKYYLWQGDYQTIPTAMSGNPELYAARLRDALPEVTTLRLPFNLNSFNADGSLHPQYERFLAAAVAEGFDLIMVQMEGDAQRLEATGPDALEQMRDALTGEVYDRMEQAWTKMLDWMDDHPSVRDAVYAHEVANEPAAYNTASTYADKRSEGLNEFVPLYAEQMVELGQMIDARSGDAKIMVGGWNYSANFQQLADIAMGDGSALDYIREGLGDSLVWSGHLYPGWLGTKGISDPDEIRAILDEIYAPITGDSFILTETNAQGNEAFNLQSTRLEVQGFVQSYDWFADHGVAVGWFTGSQYGESNLSRMDEDGTLRYTQQASYAAAMDAFTLGGEDPDHAGAETPEIELIQARLRNQKTDPDYDPDNQFDIAQYLGFAHGDGGNDTLNGSAEANNFLYGGTGKDRVLGNRYEDFLYGQDGNDVVDGGSAGYDILLGGRGNDSVFGGTGISQMYGGAGGDTLVAHPHGTTVIADFEPAEGDFLIINERPYTAEDFRAAAEMIDWNGSGALDIYVSLPGGGRVLVLDMGDRLDDVVAAILPAEGNVDPVDPVTEDDLLQGRPGADSLDGGAGNDTIYGDPVDSAGDDELLGGDGHDLIYGVGGIDYIDGGAGNDELYGDENTDLIYGGENNDLMQGGSDMDTLYGGNGVDTLNGQGGNDVLYGGGGSDTLYGEDSNDFLSGDGANDLVYGGAGVDTIDGGNGNDLLYGDDSNDSILGGKDVDTLYGGNGNDTLSGGSESDLLYGEGSADLLYGDAANDTLFGGAGGDELHGGDGNDSLDGEDAPDVLFGEDGNDTLNGGDTTDELHGGAGDDSLFGGAGNDTLSGGAGQDDATGGGGADTFVFASGDQNLRVTDFAGSKGDILRIDSALLGGEATMAALQERTTLTDAGTTIEFADGETILMDSFRGTLTDSMVDFF